MSPLPEGWLSCPLLDIVELHDSRRVPLNQTQRSVRSGPYPYYGANGKVDSIDGYLFDGEYLLLAEDGGYFDDPSRGVAYEVSGKFWVNNHAHILSAREGISLRFLKHALNSVDWMPYVGGTTRLKLTQEGMRKVRIPVPSMSEQQRIVAKLDALLARSDHIRDELARIPSLIERYKRAVLGAGFRGEFTKGPRREWKKQALAEICDPRRGITYGVIKLGTEITNGTPCLRTSNVRWLRVDAAGVKLISPALSSQYARTILRGGEVLVNVRGTLGGVAVATPEMVGWNVSREVAVVPVDIARVDPAYVAYWIGSDTSQRWLSRVEKGVAYTGINLGDLRDLPIELPSKAEQQEIVSRVREAFLKIDALVSETDRATELLNRLDDGIFAKAFCGELVPHDRPAERASIMDGIDKRRAGSEQGAKLVRHSPSLLIRSYNLILSTSSCVSRSRVRS